MGRKEKWVEYHKRRKRPPFSLLEGCLPLKPRLEIKYYEAYKKKKYMVQRK